MFPHFSFFLLLECKDNEMYVLLGDEDQDLRDLVLKSLYVEYFRASKAGGIAQ